MNIDVIDLRDFYSQRLGIVARQLINRGIRARWPNTDGQRVLGIGYPTPYLGLFREDAERCIAFMPAAQGVLKWPTARPTLAALIDQFSMPLPDAAVDRNPFARPYHDHVAMPHPRDWKALPTSSLSIRRCRQLVFRRDG